MKNLSNSVQYNLEQDLTAQQQSFARKNIHARKIWADATELLDITWAETTEIIVPDNQIYLDLGTIPNTVRVIHIKLDTANGFAADFAIKFFIPDNPILKSVLCFVDDELTNTKNMPTGNYPYKSHNYYLIRVRDTFAEYQNYFSSEGISSIIPDIDGKHQEHIDTAITFSARGAEGAEILMNKEEDSLNMGIGYSGIGTAGSAHSVEIYEVPITHISKGIVGSAQAEDTLTGFNFSHSSSSVEVQHAEESCSPSIDVLSFEITPPPPPEEEGSSS